MTEWEFEKTDGLPSVFCMERLTLPRICDTINKILFKGRDMTNLEWVNKFFERDGFVKLAGVEIVEVDEQKAVVRAKISDDHRNANGAVQGGMLYTLADFAFAVLGNYKHPVTVTQVGQISYVKAAMTDEVIATAVERVRSGHTTVSEVTIQDQAGQTVCVCTFNGFVKDIERK